MKKPDWKFWGEMPQVKLWQAVALSLNLDPDGIDADCIDSEDLTLECDSVRYKLFGHDEDAPPSNETLANFSKRLRLLVANLSNREFFSAGTLNMGSPALHGVKLNEFAVWCFQKDIEIPDGLRNIGEHGARQSTTDERPKWEIPDRLEHRARKIGEQWMNAQSMKPGVDEIAKYVEKELKDRDLRGPRGDYWDWQTIKRGALKGITGRKANGKG